MVAVQLVIGILAFAIFANGSPTPSLPEEDPFLSNITQLSAPGEFDVQITRSYSQRPIDPMATEFLALFLAANIAKFDLDHEINCLKINPPSQFSITLSVWGPSFNPADSTVKVRYVLAGLPRALYIIARGDIWTEFAVTLTLDGATVGHMLFEARPTTNTNDTRAGDHSLQSPAAEENPNPKPVNSIQPPNDRLNVRVRPLPNAAPLTRDGIFLALILAVVTVAIMPTFTPSLPIDCPWPFFGTRVTISPPGGVARRTPPFNSRIDSMDTLLQIGITVVAAAAAVGEVGLREQRARAFVDGTETSWTELRKMEEPPPAG